MARTARRHFTIRDVLIDCPDDVLDHRAAKVALSNDTISLNFSVRLNSAFAPAVRT
jgi:hypothetical protein